MSSDISVKLRPCPFCGNDEPRLCYDNGLYEVRCDECGAASPTCFDAEAVAAFWNERAYDDDRRRI